MGVIIRLAIAFFVCLASPVFGGTYWVSATGSAQWASCQSATDPGAGYCSLNYANNYAKPGDTVYYKGGTYNWGGPYDAPIAPRNSGTGTGSGRIVFAAAPGASPVFVSTAGRTYGVYLGYNQATSYVKISGFTFKNFSVWGYIVAGSSHNEIANCTFTSDTGDEAVSGLTIAELCVGGGSTTCYSTHNWIHGNTFSRGHGSADPCTEGMDLIRIGYPGGTSGGTTGANNYNTVENNNISYAGHAGLDQYGQYAVIKNNIFHNEPWRDGTGCSTATYPATFTNTSYNGQYGHRNFQVSEDFLRDGTYMLIEGNRSGHASTNPNNDGADNFDLAAPKNIVRYNFFYNAMNDGLTFKYSDAQNIGQGGTGSKNNRVYNNTIYHSGYGYAGSPAYDKMRGMDLYTSYQQCINTGNVAKNNVIYQSSGGDLGGGPSGCNIYNMMTFANNWCTFTGTGCSATGDPKFVNPDLTQPTSSTLPDLSLQSSSSAIDGGTYLTTARGSASSSTYLVVTDALYFQDGTWGSDLARGVTLFPDWIAIGTVTNAVPIASVNYNTNTITLASPMAWNDGAKIWLYKKSDGTQVLYGAAPDYGAYEYGASGNSSLSAPANLRVAP